MGLGLRHPHPVPFEIVLSRVRDYTRKIALGLGVVGLVNIQLAVKNDIVYVLEANPRASRTVPFVSKATGIPLAKIAAKIMMGQDIADLGYEERVIINTSRSRKCSSRSINYPVSIRCSDPR